MGGYQLMVSADILEDAIARASRAPSRSRRSPLVYRLRCDGEPRVLAGPSRDGAGAIELVPALRSQSADVRASIFRATPGDYAKHPADLHAPGRASFIDLAVVTMQ